MGASPHGVASVIDSQSVKAAEIVTKSARGFDPGKRINGRKLHVIVDFERLPLLVTVTPTDVHDSRAARTVLTRLRQAHLEIEHRRHHAHDPPPDPTRTPSQRSTTASSQRPPGDMTTDGSAR
ncbi:transposase [Streptomyces sp. NPDC004250]|uniref:transposase n=1 Tax=Streptomyces sp. NPDC004250 TaxID=3364692 RepID=UPI003682EA27